MTTYPKGVKGCNNGGVPAEMRSTRLHRPHDRLPQQGGTLRTCALTILAVSALVVSSACAVSDPEEIPDISGVWSGTASDETGSGPMGMTSTQDESLIDGTFDISDVSGTVGGSVTEEGRFLGSLRGTEGDRENCRVLVNFDVQVSGASMSGTYNGSNSCFGAFTDGAMNLARQPG